jgi:hypothetical protein
VTINFHYRNKKFGQSGLFGQVIFGHFFCPFLKSQNTFQNSKTFKIPSYVGGLF